MTTAETIHALECDLITEAEAVEQAMCESIGEVYRKVATDHPSGSRPTPGSGGRRSGNGNADGRQDG
ncbi:hypothetical protein Sa4125_05430 [Aureimonas sp. SA4125]|uniref:hypothetical protein n=1 Tax=Aureimonas sp. SA4125 TaxID=2826993 RepID=UPI001CC5FC42|nr:hypothetical protein [Aureimonas sp. SA4125]BDA83001.1 hypothetical protein Sa4125_05430 [Aureimonas sp. SA4125]